MSHRWSLINPRRDHAHPPAQESDATIQAIDDPESTFYVLRRPGHEHVYAHWPHPLLELAPHAVWLTAVSHWCGSQTT